MGWALGFCQIDQWLCYTLECIWMAFNPNSSFEWESFPVCQRKQTVELYTYLGFIYWRYALSNACVKICLFTFKSKQSLEKYVISSRLTS